jgi:prevent-host-death family protein
MGFGTDDIVPLNQVRARLSDLAEQVRKGKEKIITRNGESYVALIDARRLDHYHRLERECVHLALLDDAVNGMADVNADRTLSVQEARAKYRRTPPKNKTSVKPKTKTKLK